MSISSQSLHGLKLARLSLDDKRLFERYLHASAHRLSVYTFANIYIWHGLFEIYWTLIDGALCVFFKDAWGYFLYLPPLSGKPDARAVSAAWRWMAAVNTNPAVSRIENIEEDAVVFFQQCGAECSLKSCDYVYSRSEMARLAGDRFKSKRADCNYFLRTNRFIWRPYRRQDRDACAALYHRWAEDRARKYSDPLYRGMLGDSRSAFVNLLDAFTGLSVIGRVLVCGRRIVGCTFGCPVSQDMFCIIHEITLPGMRGASQFVFRQFCEEAQPYALINAMDDSGLENLKRVKISYHPRELVKNYVARFSDAGNH